MIFLHEIQIGYICNEYNRLDVDKMYWYNIYMYIKVTVNLPKPIVRIGTIFNLPILPIMFFLYRIVRDYLCN